MSDVATSGSRFSTALEALLEPSSRSRLAALRRGLGRPLGTPGDAAKEFYRLLPSNVSRHDEHAYWTAATLFARFPSRAGVVIAVGESVAGSLRRFVAASGGDEAEDRVERRLVQLLNARRNALDAHMRSIAALLHAAGIGIDPDRLARDLSHWDAPDRRVQSRWARDFWRAPYPNESEEVA